jgi:metallo-beta-lactamase family protein
MRITFLGAAGEVTGSCSLIEINEQKFLVDCGMFQGSEFADSRNGEPFAFDPKEIRAVFVTHAHLDHVGRLPLLVKGGFTGPIFTTAPTAKLARLIMDDAREVMEYNHRKYNAQILYYENDVADVEAQFKLVEYYETFSIPSPSSGSEEVKVTFRDSGHIFGAAFVEIESQDKKVVFSGDVGNANAPIVRDTDPLPQDLDLLVCESTYGNRIHESAESRQEMIRKAMIEGLNRGGVLMIPTFSLERTQELLYELNQLIEHKHALPHVPIFLDSPLAIDALKIYKEYPEYYDSDAAKYYNMGEDIFEFPGLVLSRTREESKRINNTPGSKVIIAGAGMMNGGRIVHHALRYLSDPNSTLLIVGYQAQGTLGRQILDGISPVKIFDESVQVKCRITAIGALSAHADQKKLVDWIVQAQPKQVIFNHGERGSGAMVERLREEKISAKSADVGLVMEV